MKFSRYDNPERAREVWREYYSDFKRLGKVQNAREIAGLCRSAERLDVALDIYLTLAQRGLYVEPGIIARTTHHTTRNTIRRKGQPHIDESDGSFSDARRKLEE